MLQRLVLAAIVASLGVPSAGAAVHWHRSHSLGLPYAGGRLVNGVHLPERGQDFETWDPVLKRSPNRGWRRWGSDRLVAIVLRVIHEYRVAHPSAQPVLIGDLSRRHGGFFGRRFGGLGHVSHQNGLDADIYYPRRDRVLRPPRSVRQIDNPLAQDLLDRFLRAGATSIFVGPHTKLHGPRKIVMQLVDHDNHMHVRIAKENRRTVYGRSEDGRPLRAVELGFPGPEKVLVIGCIHGTECAGTAVVRRLARSMPPLFDLWAVPNLNPDGTAAGTRQNGRGVDLNRNFPSGWTARGRRWSTQFSGRRPLSERETRFAARLIRRLRPRVTIWFHQHEDRVRAWGESIPSARRYARIAAMRFAPVRWPAGSASNWQNHSFPGASSFVVELPAGRLSPSVIESQVRAILRSGE